jgi:glycosyltransferase involved in cell wall biosynthesis
MKVVHVTQGYWPGRGGTELVIQRVSEELVSRHACEVTVLTTNCVNGEGFFDPRQAVLPAGSGTHNGVTIRRFPVDSHRGAFWRRVQGPAWRLRLPGNQYLRAWASGPISPLLDTAIDTTTADVYAASSFPLMHMFSTVRTARRRQKWPVLIGGLHPDDRWGFDRPMIYQAIARSLYIAYSSFEADLVLARGASASRVFIVGAGVDPAPFERADGARARVAVGLDPGRPVVGYIGQLGGHKGIDVLIRAMRLVWKRRPETQLLIAGARSRFVPVIDAMLDDLPPSCRHNVRVVHDFDDESKAGLFAATDVFAYPSGYESFGIAFVEAWAAGKPVIGCARGAVPSIVSDGVDGVLTRWQNPHDLAQAIGALVSDPAAAARMGQEGHRKMRARYTWPHVADRFHDVYRIAAKA